VDLAVIWNARAGSATGVAVAEVERAIATTTGRRVTIFELGPDRDAAACVREALAAGARTIVAAGGDGTVSACATALITERSRVELGVLPLGTSNSFAAALGLPVELEGAIAQLASPERRPVDAALVESAAGRQVMILHCMVGLHAEAITETTAAAKRRWGVLAYLGSAMRQLVNLQPFAVELTTDEHHVRCRAIAVAAANLAPLKTVLAHGPSHVLGDDGRVDVTIVAAETFTEAIATGVHLYRSARDREPASRDNVGSFSATRVSIVAEPPQRVLVDGEAFGDTPVTVETLPRALRVLATPAEAVAGEPVEAPLIGLPELEIDGARVDRS
jgi:YegS/Rv2252/BmrU family lipid kinase